MLCTKVAPKIDMLNLVMYLIGHLHLSGMLFGVAPRTDINKSMCFLKKKDNHFRLSCQYISKGPIGPFNEHKNCHFDNEYDIHISYEYCKNRSKFASHYARGTNGVGECKMDVKSMESYIGIKWIMFHGHSDYFQKPLLEGPETMAL